MFARVETRTDVASDNMMNCKPSVHPPFGLDCDITHKIVYDKTFKEMKAQESKIKTNMIPPRLPLETNLKLTYSSTTAKDYVRSPTKVKKTAAQILENQHLSAKRLAKPSKVERTLLEDGSVRKVVPKIEFYSAEDARRDVEHRKQQVKMYEDFIREKTSSTLKQRDEASWY